jgi:transposase
MGRRLRREEVVTIGVLRERGVSGRAIARQLGVDEKAVRYRLSRAASGAGDGRAGKPMRAEPWSERIALWMEHATRGPGVNLQALYEWLVEEHDYAGSYKAIQRYVRAKYPRPKLRVRRRVETPPGAQAQADWAEFPGIVVGGEGLDLHAFHLVLSHSRAEAIVWSTRQDELAWLSVHNAALIRLGGVPAVIRVDNTKTAIGSGAGPWGVVNERYAAYARAMRFHVDATRPRAPQEKGKVERRVLAHRLGFDPRKREWRDLGELQEATDAAVERSAQRRICPATGLVVAESHALERAKLQALPTFLPEPFDLVAQRRVGIDATVHFENRVYSVPFYFADQVVEVRGCTRTVQVWIESEIVAEHPRHTRERIVIYPKHYEGASTERVQAPVPLGRMGRRLTEIWSMAPERRPIDLYAALAEVAR